ncbi:MAG: sulfate transporter CysZ [Pseudomonadota bacterium]
MPPVNTLYSGFHYCIKGAALLLQPGIKRFVLVPLLANVVVFLVLTFFLIQSFTTVEHWFAGALSAWSWLTFIASFIAAFLTGLVFFLLFVIYGYSFNIITNIIAAPFYGLLAEKIEQAITQTDLSPESIAQIAVRTLKREIIKLWYFISRGIIVFFGLFILSFIPPLNLLVPVLALLWSAWVLTLQYIDYPADNHKMPFHSLRQTLKSHKYSTTGLGSTIMLGSMIPVINIVVMPVAVAAGTLMWVNEIAGKKTLLAQQ